MTSDLKEHPSVGAFYQCYKQPKAFINTLTCFRNTYPHGSIVVVSDGGFDYSAAAKHFACDYHREEHRSPGVTTIFNDKSALIDWFHRLFEAAGKIKEDYILFLEDDVQVMKPITSLSFDLNGVNRGEKLGKKLTAFLKTKSQAIPSSVKNYFYGGCGGALIKKDFLLQQIGTIENVRKAVDEIEKYTEIPHSTRFATDYYATAVFLYYGGYIGNYDGFCEHWRTLYPFRRYISKNIEVIHQDKSLYNKSLTDSEKSILGPIDFN